MKKLIIVILALVMTFMLFACDNTSGNANGNAGQNTDATIVGSKDVGIDDSADGQNEIADTSET